MKKRDRQKLGKAVAEAFQRVMDNDGDRPAAERLKTRALLMRCVVGDPVDEVLLKDGESC